MKPNISYLLLAISLASGAATGADAYRKAPKTHDEETASVRSTASTPAVSRLPPRAGDSSRTTNSQWEYWTNVTIAAGSSVNLDSQIDYSTTDTVRMTIRSAGSDLANVIVSAYWAIPQVSWYGVADVVAGSTFPYTDAGGATFNAYGSEFRLRVTNNGSESIRLSQVLLFTRVQ